MANILSITNSSFKIGSIHNEEDRKLAAKLLSQGQVVGVYNRGVNALWVDGKKTKAVKKITKIKGEKRKGRPLALTVGLHDLSRMADLEKLTKDAREFLELAQDLKLVLGSLCFIRLPIKKEFIEIIPKSSLSFDDSGTPWVQSWDPHGHSPTEQLIALSKSHGVMFPAVTSMNVSGQAEIVDQISGESFCIEKGVDIYLKDEKADPVLQGSYTIITFSSQGIELTRDGNIPGKIFSHIFGQNLITQNAKLSNYLQKQFPDTLFDGLSKTGIRMATLLYLEGGDPIKINQKLKNQKEYQA